jgi:hypothetical protein
LSVTAIRAGLETNLETISGLRGYSEIPENPAIPAAVVILNSIDYDQSFQRGLTLYNFTITLVIGRMSTRNAQDQLNDYASNTGARSIKSAIQSDKTLSGSAFDVTVVSAGNIGTLNLNDGEYLSMEFTVTVYAN